MAKPGKPLNARQQKFVDAYLAGGNATKAAISAGYSRKTARAIGPRLLKNVAISAEVERRLTKASDKTDVTVERTLREMARLAYVDVGEAFDAAGFMLPLCDIPEDTRRAIVGLEASEIFAGEDEDRSIIGHLKKVRFADKKGALDSLMKHLGIAGADRVELGQDTLRALVEAARKAAGK